MQAISCRLSYQLQTYPSSVANINIVSFAVNRILGCLSFVEWFCMFIEEHLPAAAVKHRPKYLLEKPSTECLSFVYVACAQDS